MIEKPVAYDMLYALANPVMAALAQPILEQTIGLQGIVERILIVSAKSYEVTLEHFVPILFTFDHAKVKAALSSSVAKNFHRKLAQRALRQMAVLLKDSDLRLQMAGYTSDTLESQIDQLDIARDVQVLAAIMLSKDSPPPLAIGLFGNWGMGKSYFMQAMNGAVDDLAERAFDMGSNRFCTNVIQIEFNAWHYADTHLWASLATSIFDRLNEYFDPKIATAAKQEIATNKLSLAKSKVDKAEAEKEGVERDLVKNRDTLNALAVARQERVAPLTDLSVADIGKIIDGDPVVKKSIEDALKSLGLPAAVKNITDLQLALGDTQNTFNHLVTLIRGICSFRGLGIFLLLISFATFAIPYLIEYVSHRFSIVVSATGVNVAQFSAAAVAAAAWLRQATNLMQEGMSKIDQARKNVDEILKSKVADPSQEEKDLKAKITGLEEQEAALAERVALATRDVQTFESELTDIHKTSTLKHFLSERTKADDYRKHQGLIGTVRSDFEKLAVLISEQALLNIDPMDTKSVDRIVLYIDDLDRCPASQVVEVLQAVHLLLAYPLFVVVVGVDSRWLLNSLKAHYRQLSGQGECELDTEWTSSPQHYLEKIFQIPFTLRPMDKSGYANLIGQLMRSKRPEQIVPIASRQDSSISADRSESVHVAANSRKEMREDSVIEDPVAPQPETRTPDVTFETGDMQAREKRSAFLVADDAMAIQEWEVDFAEQLYEFVTSPRAAKRLSNTYRILKAGLLQSELKTFEGNREVPGQYPVPLLLLAIMIHSPEAANEIFSGLFSATGGQVDIVSLAKSSRRNLETGKDLSNCIAQVVNADGFPNDLELFRYWAPRVVRFSFGGSQTIINSNEKN